MRSRLGGECEAWSDTDESDANRYSHVHWMAPSPHPDAVILPEQFRRTLGMTAAVRRSVMASIQTAEGWPAAKNYAGETGLQRRAERRDSRYPQRPAMGTINGPLPSAGANSDVGISFWRFQLPPLRVLTTQCPDYASRPKAEPPWRQAGVASLPASARCRISLVNKFDHAMTKQQKPSREGPPPPRGEPLSPQSDSYVRTPDRFK
jgi:hypothetical protein